MFLGMGGEGTLEQFDFLGCLRGTHSSALPVNTPTFPLGDPPGPGMYYQV